MDFAIFSLLHSKHLDEQRCPALEIVDRNNFVAAFYHLKVEYQVVHVFITFSTPK